MEHSNSDGMACLWLCYVRVWLLSWGQILSLVSLWNKLLCCEGLCVNKYNYSFRKADILCTLNHGHPQSDSQQDFFNHRPVTQAESHHLETKSAQQPWKKGFLFLFFRWHLRCSWTLDWVLWEVPEQRTQLRKTGFLVHRNYETKSGYGSRLPNL